MTPSEVKQLKQIAVALQADGLSYREIATYCGVSTTTAHRWLNPDLVEQSRKRRREKYAADPSHRERLNKQSRDRLNEKYRTDAEYRERTRMRKSELAATRQGRVAIALQNSRQAAKRGGYKPCNATIDELLDALDSQAHCCAICGVPEVELSRRLCAEHCHASGTFRGWVCYKCNGILGLSGDNVNVLQFAIDYLQKSLVIHTSLM